MKNCHVRKYIRKCAPVAVLLFAFCIGGCGQPSPEYVPSQQQPEQLQTQSQPQQQPQQTDDAQQTEIDDYEERHIVMLSDTSDSDPESVVNPFYGVWVYAGKVRADAASFKKALDNKYDACVVLTSEWENLNPEAYYSVTLGKYKTNEEAELALVDIRNEYPDAYVGYSGDYKFRTDNWKRYELWVYSVDTKLLEDDKLTIEVINNKGEKETVIVDSNTLFDADCTMDLIEGYEDGDTVLDWYKKVLFKPADEFEHLIHPTHGVFDIGVSGNHIDKFYESYWFD